MFDDQEDPAPHAGDRLVLAVSLAILIELIVLMIFGAIVERL